MRRRRDCPQSLAVRGRRAARELTRDAVERALNEQVNSCLSWSTSIPSPPPPPAPLLIVRRGRLIRTRPGTSSPTVFPPLPLSLASPDLTLSLARLSPTRSPSTVAMRRGASPSMTDPIPIQTGYGSAIQTDPYPNPIPIQRQGDTTTAHPST
jgi:hypothetical protein